MSRVTRWWWIRHAPVTQNEGRCYGQTDFPADCGKQEHFEALARTLPKKSVWVVSPLRRTHDTARAIAAAGFAMPEWIVEKDLIEQHFGSWQGRTYEDLRASPESGYHRFWLAPAATVPPGGESFEHVMARVSVAVERLNETHRGKDIVAVTHGGTIRAACAHALRLDPEAALRLEVFNTHLTILEHFAESDRQPPAWRAVGINLPPR